MSPESNLATRAPYPAHLLAPLIDLGLVRDDRIHPESGLAFAVRGRWHVLSELATALADPSLSRGLGHPGLWKWVQNGAPPHRVFEIPSWVVSDQQDDDRLDESGPVPFAKMVDWALETRFGEVPPRWPRPDVDLVKSWIPRGALTVQAKGYVRQGELILNADRWALRIPILPQMPEDLPEPRRRALQELVREAQHHWAMVRIGTPADSLPAALIAEVDFTGAPHSELLFSAGLDVLKHVVAWLAETADVLADPSVVIACLAPGGVDTITPNERNAS